MLERPAMQQTVALCDSRRLFGDALAALMSREPDLTFVGQATDASEALLLVQERHPDLLLVDGSLREVPLIEFIHEVALRAPWVKIVILAEDGSFVDYEPALGTGAKGVVLKQQPWATVAEALRLALRGQVYVAPELVARATGQSSPPPPVDSLPPRTSSRGLERLTARERQIFDLIVNGYKNQEIATLLSVSIKTVETHRASINRKLSVHSTGQMIRFAATQGLIPQVVDIPQSRRTDLPLASTAPTLHLEAPIAVAR
jgi:DNA-binding NarL/FixJ family response regulator